ncbi:MAG: PLP-dependent aspartate aminotransferase family protein [Clostridiales Family XIII bacterium]|nr:PLP-dependent aspartate aminotransferase family protein [Clostridiales Family XIII bacterium]
MRQETCCVHGAADPSHTTGAVCAPIYQSSTFTHPGVDQDTGYCYSRQQNPTREQLEKTLARLEGGTDAMAFSSGMAAIAAFMELFSPGDGIVASSDIYGGTMRLFEHISRKNGLVVSYADTSSPGALKAALTPATKAVFIETPGNPMMRVTDIAGAARLLRGAGIALAVDNTFLTPYYCRPLALGADIVVHSGTKYLGGHNDTLAGFLVTGDAALAERLRFIQKTTGAVLSPFDSFLVARGIKTLALRMERSQQNAMWLAEWLLAHRKVRAVHYAGLDSHPAIELSRRQASGFGSMISFETDSAESARAALGRVKLILYAESLGGVETLITYPLLQTHSDVPEEKRLELGITDRLLRISVGVENIDDLIEDLSQALA